MNNAFSFKRLSLLLRKQWLENNRFYGLATLALLAVILLTFIIFWISISHTNYREEETVVIYFVGLYLIGCIYASIAFQAFAEKEKGQYLLSLPATHAEKLVTVILFTTVAFFAVYTACFYLVKWAAFAWVRYKMTTDPSLRLVPLREDGPAPKVIPYLLMGFLAVQALFLLGSVYFKRFAYIKTIIVGVVFIGLYIFVMVKVHKAVLPSGFYWEGFRVVQNNIPDQPDMYRIYSYGETFKDVSLEVIKWMWAPVFWVIAWFRLKEKEI
ncbi:hypothetical protein [Flavihumibacter petaseus]|uniref:Uncharacterized protein n=1 Tax=Flavihumibacter petaseus NBRC 106054 TaxID=1220578 RepID=A0A0E9N4Q0_9BACT|nr:hypothetical protein [Flavihumibacter petaseus]GAO44809.1 hypothetical protein FPE01S_04_00520 [Flavihumibacter petaseus NBRC 106054]